MDVMSNYTEQVADHRTLDGHVTDTGTSLATPVVAATLAEALRLWPEAASLDRASVRDALRSALNPSAVPVGPTDWRPQPGPPLDLTAVLSQSAPVVVQGPQGGWGFVHAGLAEEIARRAAGASEPAKASAATARWQAEWQAARVAWWSRV